MISKITKGDSGPTSVSTASAEEDDGGGGKQKFTWWRSLKATGVVGIVILLCSIAALALSIQYAVEQKHDKLLPPHIITELEQFFEEQAFDEAAEMCEAEDGYLTRIVGSGLAQMEQGYESMANAVNITYDEETTRIFQRLSNLSLIAGISPMLGLLGTVVGMIGAFNKIAETEGGASAVELADGISLALATTFLGLVVAIPVLVAYHLLKTRALGVTAETNTIVTQLFERFRAKA
jgi:biopolymer transport protein ExbB